MYMTDVAPGGCHAAKFDSCNILLSSANTLQANILRCVRLYIKRKYHYLGGWTSVYQIYGVVWSNFTYPHRLEKEVVDTNLFKGAYSLFKQNWHTCRGSRFR